MALTSEHRPQHATPVPSTPSRPLIQTSLACCRSFKAEGDAAFARQAHPEAADAYTRALQLLSPCTPADEPDLRGALLANRCLARLRAAASQVQAKATLLAAALADATEAVRLRPRWGKAHLRLAQVSAGGTPDEFLWHCPAAICLHPTLHTSADFPLPTTATRRRLMHMAALTSKLPARQPPVIAGRQSLTWSWSGLLARRLLPWSSGRQGTSAC